MNLKTIPVSTLNDSDLKSHLKSLNIGMTPDEARRLVSLLGRDPSVVEIFIFDIEWSEHCSYKSSSTVLKKYMPTAASNVILGPGEDAGIVHFTTVNGDRYAMVIAHESHNHPSQLLPIEGAATGIGGIVRDVDCMGAHVCAVADGLRFGDPWGKYPARTRWIANGVVDGIWQYGNALGVPNLAGDVYFDPCFDDNCLVNVICLGIVKESRIIRSQVPREATDEDYDLILVGKATDGSGFGGVTFASEILDEAEEERYLGAVQVHDPFLKNILITRKANRMVIDRAAEKSIPIGMKDLGGGGLACASSEICSASGFGARIDLDKVHISIPDLEPQVIACSEAQERFILAVPPSFTEEVLKIYNTIWALPTEANGACARVIGKTSKEPKYVLYFNGECVCDAPIDAITEGICYTRTSEPFTFNGTEPSEKTALSIEAIIIKLITSMNLSSRHPIYRHYDTEVQGAAVLRPGESDAGVIAPLEIEFNSPAGIALSVDGNPYIGEVDPYWGGAVAVAESMRNVAATGAIPRALTDCLNYGNPEKPRAFRQFEQGVKGIADAARNLWQFDTPGEPVPIVSGNVSFYNESAQGRAIKPSPVVACYGVIDNYAAAVSLELKEPGNRLLLIGQRRNEMGGSAFYRDIHSATGTKPLTVHWEEERNDIHAVIELINTGLVHSCHDISDGGLAISLMEMCVAQKETPLLGMNITIETGDLSVEEYLFCESGGFIVEIPPSQIPSAQKILNSRNCKFNEIGEVTRNDHVTITCTNRQIAHINIQELRSKWTSRLEEILS